MRNLLCCMRAQSAPPAIDIHYSKSQIAIIRSPLVFAPISQAPVLADLNPHPPSNQRVTGTIKSSALKASAQSSASPRTAAMSKATTLNTGAKIPSVGLGVYKMTVPEAKAAVGSALKAGYKHIDTAQVYRNEAGEDGFRSLRIEPHAW